MVGRLTAKRLRELLHYDPVTGVFTWRVDRRGGVKAGDSAGCPNGDGYVHIGIEGRKHKAHRLAFFYMKGRWPRDDVDHVDRDRANNRWSNIRPATGSQNSANAKMPSTNRCGVKGVSAMPNGRYRAQIEHEGRHISLGCYSTIDDARAAYAAGAARIFKDFARIE